jgi:hypothetical protein
MPPDLPLAQEAHRGVLLSFFFLFVCLLIPVVNQGIDELRARMRRITEPGPAGNPVGNHAAN